MCHVTLDWLCLYLSIFTSQSSWVTLDCCEYNSVLAVWCIDDRLLWSRPSNRLTADSYQSVCLSVWLSLTFEHKLTLSSSLVHRYPRLAVQLWGPMRSKVTLTRKRAVYRGNGNKVKRDVIVLLLLLLFHLRVLRSRDLWRQRSQNIINDAESTLRSQFIAVHK